MARKDGRKSPEAAGERLTPEQLAVIASLLEGLSYEQAAAKHGIGVRTLYDWRRDPMFAEEYRRQSEAIVEHAQRKLRSAVGTAVDTLVEVMTATHTVTTEDGITVKLAANPAPARVAAAKEVLSRFVAEKTSTDVTVHGPDPVETFRRALEEVPDEVAARLHRALHPTDPPPEAKP